ncbi:hypothetical protein [Nocardia sp. IFM 10818]
MIQLKTVIEVECDRCGNALGDELDGSPWHFDTTEAALAELADHKWVHIGDRVLCQRCVGIEACELLGHSWGGWEPVENLLYSGLGRRCELCGVTDFDPPVRLPDSLPPRPMRRRREPWTAV